MTATDVPNVLDVQAPGAVRGLAEVFPQDVYPFPRVEVAQRWLREIEVPDIDCYVVLVDDAVAGFAASRGDEFFHFGIALGHWGTGLAQTAHDAVLDRMQSRGVKRAWLRFTTRTLISASCVKPLVRCLACRLSLHSRMGWPQQRPRWSTLSCFSACLEAAPTRKRKPPGDVISDIDPSSATGQAPSPGPDCVPSKTPGPSH